jgi:hypothetical protein
MVEADVPTMAQVLNQAVTMTMCDGELTYQGMS